MSRTTGSDKFSRWKNLSIKWRLVKCDFKCGRHSGFPLCCVLFYLARHECFEPWTGILPNWISGAEKIVDDKGRSWCRPGRFIEWYAAYMEKFKHRGYIACPLCLHLGRIATIKKCGCYITYLDNNDFVWSDDIKKKYKDEL